MGGVTLQRRPLLELQRLVYRKYCVRRTLCTPAHTRTFSGGSGGGAAAPYALTRPGERAAPSSPRTARSKPHTVSERRRKSTSAQTAETAAASSAAQASTASSSPSSSASLSSAAFASSSSSASATSGLNLLRDEPARIESVSRLFRRDSERLDDDAGAVWRADGQGDDGNSPHAAHPRSAHGGNERAAQSAHREHGVDGAMRPAAPQQRRQSAARDDAARGDRERLLLHQRLRVPGVDDTLDPFSLVQQHLDELAERVRGTVAAEHPVLRQAARYFFETQGKRFRPTVVLLMAQATSMTTAAAAAATTTTTTATVSAPSSTESKTTVSAGGSDAGGDVSMRRAAGDAGDNDHIRRVGSASSWSPSSSPPPPHVSTAQLQLAMITELIHTASLVHDDVIDDSNTRRAVGTVNSLFGNQLAVLAGDFLLARASVCLAQLRNCDVVELLSNVIEHLVQGECLQLRRQHDGGAAAIGAVAAAGPAFATGTGTGASMFSFDDYMRKTWYKTASLISNSCRAVTLLAGHPPEVIAAAAAYGDHLGLAYQLVDDAMDFSASADTMGKPALADIRAGTVTAPVLFSVQEAPDAVAECVRRRDANGTAAWVRRGRGVDKTLALAAEHARAAVAALHAGVPESAARAALTTMAGQVLRRRR